MTPIDPTQNRSRWGGYFIALASVATFMAFSIFVFGVLFSLGDKQDAALAAEFVRNANAVQVSSAIGVVGDVLLAAGAFFLVTRAMTARTTLPVSAFWLLVALGAIGLLMSDLVAANALIPVARTYAANPSTFTAVHSIVDVLFLVAFLTIHVGLLAVFWGETRSTAPATPNWSSWTGVAGAGLVIVAAVGTLAGVDALSFLFFGFYLVILQLLHLGIRIAESGPSPAPAATETATPARGRKTSRA